MKKTNEQVKFVHCKTVIKATGSSTIGLICHLRNKHNIDLSKKQNSNTSDGEAVPKKVKNISIF